MTDQAKAPDKLMRMSIMECRAHGYVALSIDDENGGLRITPQKCCGSWNTIKSWPIDKMMITDIRAQLRRAARRIK